MQGHTPTKATDALIHSLRGTKWGYLAESASTLTIIRYLSVCSEDLTRRTTFLLAKFSSGVKESQRSAKALPAHRDLDREK